MFPTELTVDVFDVNSGLASKNAVAADTAEVGLVAGLPLVTGIHNKERLRVLCKYVQSTNLVALVGPRAALQSNGSGAEPIAIVAGTISELYLKRLVASRKEMLGISDPPHTLRGRPPDITRFVENGSASSGAIWEPFASELSSKTGYAEIRDPSILTVSLYLVTTDRVLQTHKSELRQFVQALREACNLIATDPSKSKAIVRKRCHDRVGEMERFWDDCTFKVVTDRDILLKDLVREVETAQQLDPTLQVTEEVLKTHITPLE